MRQPSMLRIGISAVAAAAVTTTGSIAMAGSQGGNGGYGSYGPITAGPNKQGPVTKTKHPLTILRDTPPVLRGVANGGQRTLGNDNGNNNNNLIDGAAWIITNPGFGAIEVSNDQTSGGPWVKKLKGPRFEPPYNGDNGPRPALVDNNGDYNGSEPKEYDDYYNDKGIYVGDKPTLNGPVFENGNRSITAGFAEHLKVGDGDPWRMWSEKLLTEGTQWGGVLGLTLNKSGEVTGVAANLNGKDLYSKGIDISREDGKVKFHFDEALHKGDRLVTLKQLKLRQILNGGNGNNGNNGSGGAGATIGNGFNVKVAQYPNAVPTPTAIGGGLLMMGGLILRRRMRQAPKA